MTRGNILRSLVILTMLGMAGPWAASLRAQQAQQQSMYKNRAEYDALMAVQGSKDPNQTVQLADKYLADYPETKFAEMVLGAKLQAYQQLNDPAKVEETASKMLAMNPNNLGALFWLSTLLPQTLSANDPAMEQKLSTGSERAKKGLELVAALEKPANLPEEDFKKQKDQLEALFHKTSGFIALQKKEYEQAAQELKKSGEMNPSDALNFYWLGLAYMTPTEKNYEQGVWALSRAVSLTGQSALPAAAQEQAKDYLNKVYEARHGSKEGLDETLKQAASSPFPPEGYKIATAEELAPPEPEPEPVPTPQRELTVKPEQLTTFDDIQKFLQSGGEKEADTWTLLKGATLPLPGKVISATPAAKPQVIRLAVAPGLANQEAVYDVEVTLAAPLAKPLAKGQAVQFEGTLDSYRAKPFLLKFTEGKITSP